MMELLEELTDVSGYQKLAFLFSIIYIIYSVQNKSICFVFGFISAVFWAIESYVILQLKFDAALQVFYMIMSLYGLYLWYKQDHEIGAHQSIRKLSIKEHITFVLVGAILTIILFTIVAPLVQTRMALLDAGTTVFSMMATFLLVKRVVDNWIYFIVVDLIYVGIYMQTGGYLFAIMMVVYTLMAIWGFVQWRKLMNTSLI